MNDGAPTGFSNVVSISPYVKTTIDYHNYHFEYEALYRNYREPTKTMALAVDGTSASHQSNLSPLLMGADCSAQVSQPGGCLRACRPAGDFTRERMGHGGQNFYHYLQLQEPSFL